MQTVLLALALTFIPTDFEEQNSVPAASISGQPVTICTSEQYELADQFHDSCKGSHNGIGRGYCAVLAANRFCTPTTMTIAKKFGSHAISFYGGQTNKYKNTFIFTDNTPAASETAPVMYSNYMCTSDQKEQIATAYVGCEKDSNACMTDAQNMKALLCEAPKTKRAKSQQIVTEITSKTIEEK